MIFQHFRCTNVWGRKSDIAVKKAKGQPRTIISTDLADIESPMLYTKIQPQSFLGSGEEDF